MNATLIAVANMKGGVGKSATVISLAEALAADSVRSGQQGEDDQQSVLVIGLDAQASASFALAGDAILSDLIEKGRTIDVYLDDMRNETPQLQLKECVRDWITDVTHFGRPLKISLVASCPKLRQSEKRLIHSLTANGNSLSDIELHVLERISADLEPLRTKFNYIVFDCPPGISFLTEIAIRLADLVPSL